MKLTVCSVLLATLLIASSTATDVQPSNIARRHHAKVQKEMEKRGLFSGIFTGQGTWYGWQAGDMGACGTKLQQNDFYVALNHGQYGNMNQQSSWCGKTITISDGKKQTQATILDACPGDGSTCKYGALDMSRPLFNYFADFGVGVLDIKWWVNGEGGGSDSGSSGNSDNSDSGSSSDDGAEQRAAAAKAAEKKKEAAKAAAEKKQKEEEAAKKAAAEKKKKEAAAAKKKAAAEKKKAAEKAAADKVRETQKQNIAAFGEIMQTLNQMVENAVDPNGAGSSSSSATTSSA